MPQTKAAIVLAGAMVIELGLEALVTGLPFKVAPSWQDPAALAVKRAVYTPPPTLVIAPKVPVPPTELAVNALVLIPLGLALPKASLAVSVTVMALPAVTLLGIEI